MKLGTIETKVIAGAAGSGVGAATGGFLLWLAGVVIWHQPDTASAAAATVAAVPTPVSGLVLILLAIAGSAVSGYAAPHTNVAADARSAPESHAAAPAGADPIQASPSDFLTAPAGVSLPGSTPDPFMEGGVASTIGAHAEPALPAPS